MKKPYFNLLPLLVVFIFGTAGFVNAGNNYFGIPVHSVFTPKKTFTVTKGAGTKEAELAVQAIEKTDMEIYRLRSKRRTITFKSGVVIELYSAEEMKAAGFDVSLSSYTEELPANYKEPVYDIALNGHLIQYYEKIPVK